MPLGRMAALKEQFYSSAISSTSSSSTPLKIVVLHATPSNICGTGEFSGHECVQAPLNAFLDRKAPPYRFDMPSQSVDILILQGVLDNTLDVSRTIFEAQRILQPCGKLVLDATSRTLSTWIRFVIYARILRLEPSLHHNWRLFVQQEEMERVLGAYNFTQIQTTFFSTSLDWTRLLSGNTLLDSITVETNGDQEYALSATNGPCTPK